MRHKVSDFRPGWPEYLVPDHDHEVLFLREGALPQAVLQGVHEPLVALVLGPKIHEVRHLCRKIGLSILLVKKRTDITLVQGMKLLTLHL